MKGLLFYVQGPHIMRTELPEFLPSAKLRAEYLKCIIHFISSTVLMGYYGHLID